MFAPRRSNLRFASVLGVVGLLTVVALGIFLDGLRRRARRESRTAEAIAQAVPDPVRRPQPRRR